MESDGEQIYYEVTGQGSPVVLCHGLGGNHAIWWRQIEAFAGRYRVVVWDQRGFGNSTLRTGEVGPRSARRDLRALFDHLALERATVVGQSLGGYVALGFTIDNPDLVDTLVLSTTLAGAEPEHVANLINAEPDRNRSNRREHPVLSREFCAAQPDLGVLYNQISSFGARPSPIAVLSAMASDMLPIEAIGGVRARTLVMMAVDDEHCPPHAMQPVADAIPDGCLVEIAGGHSAYYERPAEWNKVVLDFLAAGCG